MDQDTRKISAAQLAEVLAKVDQKSTPTERVSGEVEARPAARLEGPPTPSSPIVAAEAPAAAMSGDAPPVSAPPQVLAVVERPADERKVVNVTSPAAPPSAPRLPVAGHDSDPPETSSARAIVPPTSDLERLSRGESVEQAEAEARKIVDAGRGGTMMSALVVVALFVVGCIALVWANH